MSQTPSLTATTAFLSRCGMNPEAIDFHTMTSLFLGQMHIGFYGGNTSIPMRPTYLNPNGILALDTPVAVVEVNERDIRTAQVTFTKDGPATIPGESFPVPGVEYPATLGDLSYAIAELLQPLMDRCQYISLCLSFPMEKTEDGEATIIRPPAGMQISNWEGVPLRAALSKELSSRGFEGKTIFLVNSIAAVLLGGTVHSPEQHRYVSLSWDASANAGFIAPKGAILKLKSGEKQMMILDCGTGHCRAVPIGSIDLIMDRDSAFPGEDLLDKMVSLQNLGELFRFTMIKAAEAGFMSYMCRRNFLSLRKLDLDTVLRFLADPEGDNLLADFCREEEDHHFALVVARAVLERAARLLSIGLASVLLFIGAGTSPEHPVLVSLGGRAFSVPLLYELFQKQVDLEIGKRLGLHYTLYYKEDSHLDGSAAAAMLDTIS